MLAEVGGVLGVLVVADVEVLVGKGAESVLDTGSGDVVVGGAVDGVGAPDAAIGVVVYHEELLADEGGRALAVDFDGLPHHVALDSGERVVAVGGGAVGAVGAAN